jgi:hypothetical protein
MNEVAKQAAKLLWTQFVVEKSLWPGVLRSCWHVCPQVVAFNGSTAAAGAEVKG